MRIFSLFLILASAIALVLIWREVQHSQNVIIERVDRFERSSSARQRQFERKMREDIQTVITRNAALSARCEKSAVDDVSPSIYRLVVRDPEAGDQSHGTGWVVDKEVGILATNIHVVEEFGTTGPSGKPLEIYAYPPGGGEPHKVTDVRLHAGAAGFDRDIKFYDPVTMTGRVPRFLGAGEAYDVAVAFVDRAEDLASALTIADDDTLHSLEDETLVMSVGYTGTTLDRFQPIFVKPHSVFGTVTGADHFLTIGADPKFAHYVLHSAPSGPGASGSPVMSCDGKVIAVESTSVTGDNYYGIAGAQRADLVKDLLVDDNFNQERVVEHHQPYWRKLIAETDGVFAAHDVIPDYLMLLENLSNNRGIADAQLLAAFEPVISDTEITLCENVADKTELTDSTGEQTSTSDEAGLNCVSELNITGLLTAFRAVFQPGIYAIYAFPNAAYYGGECAIEDIKISSQFRGLQSLSVNKSGRTSTYDLSAPLSAGRADLETWPPIYWVIFDQNRNSSTENEIVLEYGSNDLSDCPAELFDIGIVLLTLEEPQRTSFLNLQDLRQAAQQLIGYVMQ